MSLYTAIEKAAFNTLTKKIVGNVIFLLLPHLLLFLVGLYYVSELRQLLQGLALSAAQMGAIESGLAALIWAIGVTVTLALLAGVFTIFFMRHLFLRPIREITSVLRAIKEKDGDISATLPQYTHDEISELAAAYNDFSANLKRMIA